jgi:hypothetical protein
MTFDEWIKTGYDLGYCSPPVCSTHDGTPTTATEDEQWEEGDDPCLHVVRLYNTSKKRKALKQTIRQQYGVQPNLGWE